MSLMPLFVLGPAVLFLWEGRSKVTKGVKGQASTADYLGCLTCFQLTSYCCTMFPVSEAQARSCSLKGRQLLCCLPYRERESTYVMPKVCHDDECANALLRYGERAGFRCDDPRIPPFWYAGCFLCALLFLLCRASFACLPNNGTTCLRVDVLWTVVLPVGPPFVLFLLAPTALVPCFRVYLSAGPTA